MALSGLAGLVGNALNGLLTPDNIKDRRHAAKLFNQTYKYPKIAGLFHVYISLDWGILNKISGTLGEDLKPNLSEAGDLKIGLLAKSFTLPSTNYDTNTLNAYGQKVLVRKKVFYDPVTIAFHDDGDNKLFNFYRLINFIYAHDTSEVSVTTATEGYKYRPENIQTRTGDRYKAHTSVYDPRTKERQQWGLRTDTRPIRYISVYSLFAGYATKYVLWNPVISKWQLGTHDQGSSQPMEITATVNYEGITHSESGVPEPAEDAIPAFTNERFYDKSQSPLAFGRASLFGRGGLFASGAAAIGAVRSGNFLGAALIAGTTANTFRNSNLTNVVKGETSGLAQNIAGGTSAGKYHFPAAVTTTAPATASAPATAAPPSAPPAAATVPATGTA